MYDLDNTKIDIYRVCKYKVTYMGETLYLDNSLQLYALLQRRANNRMKIKKLKKLAEKSKKNIELIKCPDDRIYIESPYTNPYTM